jgi:antitoxin CptB
VTQLTQEAGTAVAAHDVELGRLRWRCRRGMKELDVLLERFALQALPQSGPAERQALGELLELADPQLADYLLGAQIPAAPHLAQLVGRIRALCRSGSPVGGILNAEASSAVIHAELSQRVTVYCVRAQPPSDGAVEGVHGRRCK